jgi:hypothetical protein
MNLFTPGQTVCLDTTTEPLLVLATDGEDCWCRDDMGTKLTLKAEDLVRATVFADTRSVNLFDAFHGMTI